VALIGKEQYDLPRQCDETKLIEFPAEQSPFFNESDEASSR